MYLFGLEGSGFIISLGLTLLICGAIMFYCLKRFAILEKSIIEQGKVLQSIIQMIESNPQHISPNQLATNIAINSALEQSKNNDVEMESTKIEVSDNSETDSNYSNSEDSNSDSDSDSDNGNSDNGNSDNGNSDNGNNNSDNENNNTELKLEKLIHLDIENQLYNKDKLDIDLDIKTDNILDIDSVKSYFY